MTLSPVNSLAFQGEEFELGTISVGPDGALTRHALIPLKFTFTVEGVDFEAEAKRVDGDASLHVTSTLGPMPYSAEGVWRRVDLDYLISSTRQRKDARLMVGPDRMVRYDSAVIIHAPLTPITVLTAAVEAVARGKKLIDLARMYLIAVKPTNGQLQLKGPSPR